MKRRRVAILAFADSHSRPLPSLTHEADRIQEILHAAESATHIHPVVYPRMSLDGIASVLRQQKWQVEIFHFAGHADAQSVHLTDLGVAFGRFGRLLAEKHRTKLVFLNGCGTEQMVAGLLKAGVPAVIATKTKISDDRASSFAIRFYEALKENFTLEDAFWYAMDLVSAENRAGLAPVRGEVRHLHDGEVVGENAWVLHINDESKKTPDWTLGRSRNSRLFQRRILLTVGAVLLICGASWYTYMLIPLTETILVKVRPYVAENFDSVKLPEGYSLITKYEDQIDSFPLLDWEQTIPIRYSQRNRDEIGLYLSKDGFSYSDPEFQLEKDTNTYILPTAVLVLDIEVDDLLYTKGLPDTLILVGKEPIPSNEKEFKYYQKTIVVDPEHQLSNCRLVIRQFVSNQAIREVEEIQFEVESEELDLVYGRFVPPDQYSPFGLDTVDGFLTYSETPITQHN